MHIRETASKATHGGPVSVLVWILMTMILMACNRDPVSMPLPSDGDFVAHEKRLLESVTIDGAGGSRLSVSPGRVSTCPGLERGTAALHWSAPTASAEGIRLEVSNPDSRARQLFAAGGHLGEAVAEGWFSSGVTFHLIDTRLDKELLTYKVEAIDCGVP